MHTEQAAAQGGETFKISFIITYYNIPLDMLQQCIESIMSLDLHPEEREIILVDDGSPINPKAVVEKYGSSIVYIKQENRGVAIARNRGLDAAQGSHIQFVDADDYLLKADYNHCISLVRKDKELDIVTFNYTQQQGVLCGKPTETKPVSGPDYMLHHNIRGINCVYLFRRNLMEGLRFTPGLLHEDEEFVPLLLLKAKHMVSTTACAYFYRQRCDSITNKEEEKHLQKRMGDIEYIIVELYGIAQKQSKEEYNALMRRVHQLTMDYLYNTIKLVGNTQVLEETVARLRAQGLFPLPDKRYTLKYTLFRIVSESRAGRKLLLRVLS